MIHYHGTPITPRHELEKMKGEHFCVSFAHPQDADWCLSNGQSVMWDNGAFSAFTKGKEFDEAGYIRWLEPRLFHPHWAVIPDVIGGDVEQQSSFIKRWPYHRSMSAPVWHIHLSYDWLLELSDMFPKVCFGSSAQFWKIGTDEWCSRIDGAFEALERHGSKPFVHMLRAMSAASKGGWPFGSADSTNVARNFKTARKCPFLMARSIDAKNPSYAGELSCAP